MAVRWWQAKLGFSTAATQLRPPEGEVWIINGIVEIGSAPTIQFSDGTTNEDWVTSDQNIRGVSITNEWYLTCAATTAAVGWLVTIGDSSEVF